MIKQQSISFEVTEYETENQNKKLSTPNFNSPEAFQKIPNKTRKHSQHKQHVKSLHQHANLNSADTLENDPRIHGRKTQTGGQFKKFVLKVIEWIQKSIALGGNENESGGSPDEVQLDAEMDKVFAGSSQDKFDVTKFSSPTDGNPAKYKINEYEGAQRKKISVGKTKKDSGDRSDTVSPTSSVSPVSSPSLFKEKMQRNVDTGNNKDRDDDDDDQPLVSERAGYGDHSSDSSSEYRRVQFERNMPQRSESFRSPSDEGFDPNNDDHRKRKGRHEHYKVRKYSLQESRKQSGSDPPSGRKISVQPEDAQLEEADIDDLTSHRSDDPRGRRRNKIVHSNDGRMVEKLSNTTGQKTTKQGFPRKHFDHSPHEVFVQLDELKGTGEDREWKETARWIKYEEDVEEGSDRWGRPHVASLSFHSLLNLRRCLETGVVLMDLEERDLPGVAYRVVEQMVIEELIHEEDKPTLMRSLLLRHRHVNEHSQLGFSFGKRKISSYTSLQNLSESKSKVVPSSEINGNYDAKIDMREETYSSSQEDIKKAQNDSILKRIPVGAEATTVLVGAVDFLNQPTIAFVRLAEGIQIPGVTEVPIPVRFIFILLGPKNVELDYHEVGRSIATLMSNEHFHKIAYKADDRRDLLSAINEFLDDSIVLPPGNWQRTDLLPFDELKARNDWIRERKSNALKERNKDKKQIIDEEKKLLASGLSSDDAEIGGLKISSTDKNEKKKPVGPLEKTNRLWGGLVNDLKRRLPMYKSDIMDGLNTETLAATLFMYFAALSTAITFGGLASDKTFNLIGISETLLAASMVGMVFHAIAGQPLVIIGTTGPLLLFDEALYQFCLQYGYSFLTVRVYVGIWMAAIALIVSAFEGSVYVRLFTRFTQEIFSALITLIYIVETALKLVSIYKRHPLYANYAYLPNAENTNLEQQQTTISDISLPIAEALVSEPIITSANYTTSEIASTMTTAILPLLQDNIISTDNNSDVVTNHTLLVSSDSIGPLNQPNTALFCTLLTLATFSLAYYLRLFRNSHFLGRNARRALGDFGVPISIAIFVVIDYMIPQVFTDKLTVPEGISPSEPTVRGWLIPLNDVPIWLPFVCGIPAILVYILAFMETHISELIVDKPERGLKKGSGLHFDIVLLCFLNAVCGFLGMPWHCAATVRSVTHVSAVTIMSRDHAPGDKPYIADVKEQRVSGFVVSLFVGLSVAMAPLLRLIPMSVLFGVFLYMGIASMSGVQFFDRLRLFLMPVKYHPQEQYVRRVPTWKMHTFTMIQVLALALLWAVKSSSFSLAFPFVLVLMVPLRQKLTVFFTEKEIKALDDSQAKVEPDDEPDFYEQAPIPA